MATDEEVGVKLSLKGRRQFSGEADKAAKDIKKISKAADEANRSTRNASTGFKSFSESTKGIQTAAKWTAGVVAGVTTTLGALGSAATFFGIKTAAAFEQSEIGMTVLLKSSERALAMVGDLRAYAKESPFGFQDVQTGAQRLLAMGYAADEIMPLMKTLGNAAASGIVPLEEGLWRLTYAFGQMKAAGRIQGDEIRQLEEMGIPVRKALSEGFNIPMKELPKAIRAGILDGEKGIQILTKTINENFGGMTEAQRKSWVGMWANLKETAALNAGETARAMMEPFKPAFAQLGIWADRQGQKAAQFAQKWATRFNGIKNSGVGTFDAIVFSLDDVTGAQGKVTKAFKRGKEIAQDVSDIWKNSLWPAIQDISKALGGEGGLLSPLGAILPMLEWMADHPDAGKAIFEGMAIAIISYNLAQAIGGVTTSVGGLKLALAAPGGLMGIILSLPFALGLLYTKLDEGNDFWTGFGLALGPIGGQLFSMRKVLGEIVDKIRFIDNHKNIGGNFSAPPPGSSPNQGGGGVAAMAEGGVVRTAGVSLVGERGPELLRLPVSARVDPLPNDSSEVAFGGNVIIEDGAIRVSGADVLNANRVADIIVTQIQDKVARK